MATGLKICKQLYLILILHRKPELTYIFDPELTNRTNEHNANQWKSLPYPGDPGRQ